MPGTRENLWSRAVATLDGLRLGIQNIDRLLRTGTISVSGSEVIVDDGKSTITIDGVTYSLTMVVNEDGATITPVSKDNLYAATTETNALLHRVIKLLEELVSE